MIAWKGGYQTSKPSFRRPLHEISSLGRFLDKSTKWSINDRLDIILLFLLTLISRHTCNKNMIWLSKIVQFGNTPDLFLRGENDEFCFILIYFKHIGLHAITDIRQTCLKISCYCVQCRTWLDNRKKNLEYRQHKYGKTVHVIDRSYIWVLKNAVEYEDRQTLVKLHISVDNQLT